jgi:hypothetical protein
VGDPVLVLCGDDAVQRADLPNPERTPWHEPKTPQVGKHGGVPVLYPRDDETSAGLRPTEGSRILRRQRAIGLGDGRAMGITLRMAQKLGQALRELVGDGVLQPLGLLVYFLPRIP